MRKQVEHTVKSNTHTNAELHIDSKVLKDKDLIATAMVIV
jgi:hypothetical protein